MVEFIKTSETSLTYYLTVFMAVGSYAGLCHDQMAPTKKSFVARLGS